ncbi:MAG TPA: HAMP domain-containing sensor histidine kinase [Acetobacteraceae bacterium]|nr:HAMP domain-containing sensor histidine kinase [Acetobacteraceae bacterium]
MTDTPGPGRLRWLRSIRVQAFALLLILIVLPVLIFAVLGNAEAERRLLIRNAVAETGDTIAAGLVPVLRDLWPADLAALPSDLSRFAARGRSIKVLFRPKNAVAADTFYFVATAPAISAEQTEAERQQLLRLGILPGLSQGCIARPLSGDSEASLLDNGTQVLTSVTSLEGVAGCWAVVIATSESRVLGAIEVRPYWERPEVRLAIGIYGVMALLIAAIFSGVWFGLSRFRRLALSPTEQTGFARTTAIPELATLAAAFDNMVHRMRASADMLRQAAEDNAHAFKGPIGIIRHATVSAMRQTNSDKTREESMHSITAALDRLDGLVQSARYLDNAAAELLQPEMVHVDLSALVRGFVRSYATMNTRRVRLDSHVIDGIAVAAQPENLEAILEALVDNALSFSPSDGSVTVTLEHDTEAAILTVDDEGPGVAPERLERIFDRYYTHRPADNTCSREASSHFGVGLWLARQNTIALGGTLSATNREPHGLCMKVLPPLAG